jgi:GNAT superfamily N-acetyltransferase
MLQIKLVRSESDSSSVKILANEFIDWLRERYPEMPGEIDEYLKYQNFEAQVYDVRERYNPPQGECLLALYEGVPVGILMMKDMGNQVCEMNRMYVRSSARGLGAGRALVHRLIECAKDMGFSTMTLSALPKHFEALPLYQSLGFIIDDCIKGEGNTDKAIMMRLDLSV